MVKKMKNKRKIRTFATVFLMLVIIAVIVVGIHGSREEDKYKNISLIVYGNDSARWENLRQGAELAAADENCEISLITMSDESDYEEQIRLIKREIEKGTDALLIAACNSQKLADYFDNEGIKLPVTFVETGINSKKSYPTITVNDYELGKALGEELVKSERANIKVAIICENEERESVEARKQGVRDTISGRVKTIVEWKRNDYEKDAIMRTFLQRELVSEAVDVIVVLDNSVTDSLINALDNLNRSSKVYAISTSAESVYSLDEGKIKALVYPAEFGIGYLGAKYIFDDKNRNIYDENNVYYRVVKKDNMYDYNNETLLFPFVK